MRRAGERRRAGATPGRATGPPLAAIVLAALLLCTPGVRCHGPGGAGRRLHGSRTVVGGADSPPGADGHAHGADEELITCTHGQHVAPQSARHLEEQLATPHSERLRANAPRRVMLHRNPAPIRFHVEYQFDQSGQNKINLSYQEAIRTRYMPLALSYIKRTVMIKEPVAGSLKLPRHCTSKDPFSGECTEWGTGSRCLEAIHNETLFGDYQVCIGGSCEQRPGGLGASGADVVLYVTGLGNTNSCQGGSAASGGHCIVDPAQKNRPVAIAMNICPRLMEIGTQGTVIDTLVHEIMHGLVFTRSLYDLYVDASGTPRGPGAVFKTSLEGKNYLVGPKVVSTVRDHFSCQTLEGAELENEGGGGATGSHWESRIHASDVMRATARVIERQAFTNLTMALMEDSGWYVPRYEAAVAETWGRGKGCVFANGHCASHPITFEGFYCQDNSEDGPLMCSADRLGYGQCRLDKYRDGCSDINIIDSGRCNLANGGSVGTPPRWGEYFWGEKYGENSRCLEWEGVMKLDGDVTRPGTFNHTKDHSADPAGCFEFTCDMYGRLFVHVGNVQGTYGAGYKRDSDAVVRCPAGEFIDLASLDIGFTAGRLGPCPDQDMCGDVTCPSDCSEGGVCDQVRWHLITPQMQLSATASQMQLSATASQMSATASQIQLFTGSFTLAHEGVAAVR